VEGKPRLSDFGLAQDLGMEGLTQSGESFGSPRYMSPEQAFRRKLPVDQRSDIYSLGVTLYEMLTLRYPYEAATSVEYMNELAQGRVVPPRKADATIPAALESVLLRALAKDPAQRYPDASAFAGDLKAVLEERPVSARPSRRWTRRTGLWVGVAAGLALLGLGGFWWLRQLAPSLGPSSQWLVGGSNGVALGDLERMPDQSHARVELRSYQSRRAPDTYACVVDLPQGVGEGEEWLPEVQWSVSIDGKNWKPITVAGEILPREMRWRVPLREVLGEAIERDSVTLQHRLDSFRLRQAPGRSGGTIELTRVPNTVSQTIFLYDELPADYPEALSNSELDQQMRTLLTPGAAHFEGTRSLEGGKKAIQVGLGLLTDNLPAPVAGELALHLVGEDQPFARGRLVCAEKKEPFGPAPVVLRVRPVMRAGSLAWLSGLFPGPQAIDFVLEPMAPEKEVQLLLDLKQGRTAELRVVFEPSRTVARESSPFDRYWNGSIDVTVPLGHAPEVR
jgi:hypothetical protein